MLEDKKRVISGGLWCFDNELLICRDSVRGADSTNFVYNTCTFWIQKSWVEFTLEEDSDSENYPCILWKDKSTPREGGGDRYDRFRKYARQGAMHDALTPLLDQGVLQRMANLGLGPQASHDVSRLWIQAISASRALGDGHTLMSQQTHTLDEALNRESLKVSVMEQKLQELRTQVNNYPRDFGLEDQELRRAEAERDAANQAAFTARREREGLRCAFLQDSPRRCRRIGAAVLSNFVLNCQDRAPALSALAEENRQWYLAGWMDNKLPLPPIE
ncbi:hypothetical protein LIER_35217 [Lithospermum erythrorhizon]|uniref:Uncharacterized protein n=1 Tax=Lithospermum erythrorhizon TaxID=34254 RepID=A0AAV3NRD1_LITER